MPNIDLFMAVFTDIHTITRDVDNGVLSLGCHTLFPIPVNIQLQCLRQCLFAWAIEKKISLAVSDARLRVEHCNLAAICFDFAS